MAEAVTTICVLDVRIESTKVYIIILYVGLSYMFCVMYKQVNKRRIFYNRFYFL